ncbi:MAG: dienelactone hydrolase family protein [Gammaproteobacteria bacterium]
MKTYTLDYEHQGTTLEAFIADDGNPGKKPVVLIAHAWAGRDDFACEKAKSIAELGYIGFALDMYGKGIVGNSVEENSTLMSPFMKDRSLLRDRMIIALNAAKSLKNADTDKIVVMGFCFGGLCALDLARSGTDIQGVISFHGLLDAPEELAANPIKAKILVLHGYDDPMVPPKQLTSFLDEMTKAGADWQCHAYGNTQHAFTNPQAKDIKLGTIYNAVADKRSWGAMASFLEEVTL